MKLKFKLGEGGWKGFFARHVEKIVFGGVMVLLVVFLYMSAMQPGVSASKSPTDLDVLVDAARKDLDKTQWRDVAEQRVTLISTDVPWQRVLDDPDWLPNYYSSKVKDVRGKIDENRYQGEKKWVPPMFKKGDRRRDPKILAPTKLEVQGLYAAMAVRVQRPNTAWVNDKDALEKTAEKPAEKPAPKSKSSSKKAGGSGSSYYEEMYSPTSGGGSGRGSSKGGSRPPSKSSAPAVSSSPGGSSMSMADYYEQMGGGGGESMYGSGMSGGMYGAGGAAAGGRRKLGPFYMSHYLRGVTTVTGGARVAAVSYGVVAVKAVVPFERQWEEYERALAESVGYVPQLDVPRYLYFVAQRAEVSDDPQAELKWEDILNTKEARDWVVTKYGSYPKEVADDNCVVPPATMDIPPLTMPIPPILLTSYDALALHSEIPRKQMRPAAPAKSAEEEGEAKEAESGESLPELPKPGPGGAPVAPGGAYEGAPSYPGGGMPPPTSGMSSGPMGADGGSGYGGMSMPGYGSSSGYGGMSMPGYGSSSGYGGMSSPGYGATPGAMSGGYGSAGYGGAGVPGPQIPKVKYKLVRFFDFKAETGKSYRYRVQLWLEDPNRRRDATADPNRRNLAPEVIKRIDEVEAKDKKYSEDTGRARRTYYIKTDWSEPSPVVRIENPERVLAGSAVAAKSIALSADGPTVQTMEPAGKVISVVWDEDRAVEVPAEREISLGSLLNFTQNADVLHPLTLQIKTLENYRFKTDGVVLDMRGGEELFKAAHLTTPGEYLVADQKGSLVVCNEVDDAEEYRRVLFIEDKGSGDRPAASASPGMEYGPEGGAPSPDYFGP